MSGVADRPGAPSSAAPWRFRFGDPLQPLVELFARGGVAAIPTESSYGLAADPGNRLGIETIFRIKGRERGKPLPVVVAGAEQLFRLGIDPGLPILEALAACWPGPLTAVLPIEKPLAASAGAPSLAVRVPGHPELLLLLAALGHGLTATSANRSGGEAIVDPAFAFELLAGEDAVVVDGGILPGGPPSTLIAPAAAGPGFEVLRSGRFPLDRLRERWALARSHSEGSRPAASGPSGAQDPDAEKGSRAE